MHCGLRDGKLCRQCGTHLVGNIQAHVVALQGIHPVVAQIGLVEGVPGESAPVIRQPCSGHRPGAAEHTPASPPNYIFGIPNLNTHDKEARVRAGAEQKYGPGITAYRDFREMLPREDIDALLIATGDRWHTMAAISAARAGKDVYCEKPCSMTIAESQALARA